MAIRTHSERIGGNGADGVRLRTEEPATLAAISDGIAGMVRLAGSRRFHSQRVAATEIPLSPTGYELLGRVDVDGFMRMSDLAAAADLQPSAVTAQVRHLEEAGLVARDQDPSDGRVTLVRITALGRRTRQRVQAMTLAYLDQATADWTADERAVFSGQLQRLLDGLHRVRVEDR